MGIRTKLLFSIILVAAPAFLFLIDWVVDDLTPQYRESTEEPLVDAAHVLAQIAAASSTDSTINVQLFKDAFEGVYNEALSAQIYDFLKTSVDFRVYITDRLGVVLFDSYNDAAVGSDYSHWRDVARTLRGEYGARTSRDIELETPSSIMYVAAPIKKKGELLGVLSVGKPTKNANHFVETAQREIVFVGSVCALIAFLVAFVVSGRITKPIALLTQYAKAVRDGERVPSPKVGGRELRQLAEAFESMRDTLEGKKYVEKYVQTLTHEVKSPLSAIQGACELLEESPPPEKQEQFLANIRSETQRIKDIVEKLLLLSQLEAKKQLEERTKLQLAPLVQEVLASHAVQAEKKNITISTSLDDSLYCLGDEFLLRQAMSNIVQNAIEFSAAGGRIELSLREEPNTASRMAEFQVLDDGPGIPSYATERVFERFYSLKRPDTGKKSSGLGLSFVREVATIHGGSISIHNEATRGVCARMRLPILQ